MHLPPLLTNHTLPHLPGSLAWAVPVSWRDGDSQWEQSYAVQLHIDSELENDIFNLTHTHLRVTQKALSTRVL